MKKITAFILLCLCVCFAACGQVRDPKLHYYYQLASSDPGKGIEFYLFEVKEEYQFVMMPGTNRLKSPEEVNALPLADLSEMKDIVGTMSTSTKDRTVVHYVKTYPCDIDSLQESYAYHEEDAELLGLIRLQLGLAEDEN